MEVVTPEIGIGRGAAARRQEDCTRGHQGRVRGQHRYVDAPRILWVYFTGLLQNFSMTGVTIMNSCPSHKSSLRQEKCDRRKRLTSYSRT